MKLSNISEAMCKVRYVKVSPVKVRRIAGQIRNRPYDEALLILAFLPHKPSTIIMKALRSAISNYKQMFGMDISNLVVKEIRVDNAPFLKRLCPHAQGRGFPIKKHYSHITSLI